MTNIGNLRPNIIKIDRSFTLKALENSYEFDLLLHIVKMVHGLGLALVVEGIETAEELARIALLEPDYIQGYYYSKQGSASAAQHGNQSGFRKVLCSLCRNGQEEAVRL